MSSAAQGGRSQKAPTRAAKQAPIRAAKKAPARPPKKAAAKTATDTMDGGAVKAGVSKRATKRSDASASTSSSVFDKVRALCLALPDTKLTMTWGSPHFRVGEKIFCGFGEEEGKPVMGVKLELSHARRRVKDARFWPSPYVGKHGWVSMNVAQRKSWDEVEALIRESYGLIAPRASLKKLR